jgi:hypothetical protein
MNLHQNNNLILKIMAIGKGTIGMRCLIKNSLNPNEVTEANIAEFSRSGKYVKLRGICYAGPHWRNASEVEIVEILESE